MTKVTTFVLWIVCWVLVAVLPATAQTIIDRPITIYVAGTAGGGIDLYARMLARHIGRHIPGRPVVSVQVMPGAGGIRAANYLAEQAPKGGTAITAFASGPILEPLIGTRHPGYFNAGQGTELLTFLARVLEHCLRQWLGLKS